MPLRLSLFFFFFDDMSLSRIFSFDVAFSLFRDAVYFDIADVDICALFAAYITLIFRLLITPDADERLMPLMLPAESAAAICLSLR